MIELERLSGSVMRNASLICFLFPSWGFVCFFYTMTPIKGWKHHDGRNCHATLAGTVNQLPEVAMTNRQVNLVLHKTVEGSLAWILALKTLSRFGKYYKTDLWVLRLASK